MRIEKEDVWEVVLHSLMPGPSPGAKAMGGVSTRDTRAYIHGPASVAPPPLDQVWSMDLTPRPPLWWWKGAYLLITTFTFTYLVT